MKYSTENKFYYISIIFISFYEIIKNLLGLSIFLNLLISAILFLVLFKLDDKFTRVCALSIIFINLFNALMLPAINFATGEFVFLMLVAGFFLNERDFKIDHTKVYLSVFLSSYITSSITKFYNSGFSWVTDASDFKLVLIRYSKNMFDGLIFPELPVWLADLDALFPFFFLIIFLLEASSFLMLINEKIRSIYSYAFLSFHISVIFILDLYFTSYILVHLIISLKSFPYIYNKYIKIRELVFRS